MSLPTPTAHVTHDQFHLTWDPAIPPVATVACGDVVEFDCSTPPAASSTPTSTVDDLGRLDFDRVDQVNGPIAVARRGAGRHAPDRPARRSSRPTGAGRRRSRASGCSPTTSPTRASGSRACRVPAGAPSSCPASASRSRRSAARSASRPPTGPLLDDPAGPPRRQHGHPPPDRRLDALPARLPRPARGCRWATATPPRATARCAGRRSRRRCGRTSA